MSWFSEATFTSHNCVVTLRFQWRTYGCLYSATAWLTSQFLNAGNLEQFSGGFSIEQGGQNTWYLGGHHFSGDPCSPPSPYCSFKTTFITGRIQVKVLPSRRDVFFLFEFSSICGTNCQSCGEILQNIDLIFFMNFLRKWNKINVVSAWTWIRPVFIKAKGHCRNYCHISVSLLQDSTIQLQVPRDLISCSLEFSAYPCFEIWPLC